MSFVAVTGQRSGAGIAAAAASFGRRCRFAEIPGLVGCARGADAAFAEAVAPLAIRFAWQVSAGSLPVRAALAHRSVLLVQAARLVKAPIVGFVSRPCPASLGPTSSWPPGFASGAWQTLSLAAGLGLEVYVDWCAPGMPRLPGWGTWHSVAGGIFRGYWRLRLQQIRLPNLV